MTDGSGSFPTGSPLPSEMLSGPDTGGGFLFQLTVERSGTDAPGFTFHAQEGGEDAGGPPKGSPEPLGFAHPAAACMYGGPRCWHRHLRLPPEAAGAVRAAYTRMRSTFAVQIEQAARRRVAPIADGLRETFGRIAAPLEEARIPWFVGGSTGAWLQGARVEPRDIDIGTTEEGVRRIGELLEPYLVEPAAPVASAPRSRWSARAFVGTFLEGVRVEWASVDTTAPALREFEGEDAFRRLVPVRFEGQALLVSRIEFSLVRWAARGETARVDALGAGGTAVPVDPEFLRAVAESEGLSAAARSDLFSRLSAAARRGSGSDRGLGS